MSSTFSAVSSPIKDKEVDKTFISEVHQAAQEIGLSQGRRYLVISNGKLELSIKKSEETPFEKLTEFVNQKLEGLEETEIARVKVDLSKIGAKMLQAEQAKLIISSDLLRTIIGFLDLKACARTKRVCHDWNNQIDQRVKFAIYRAMIFTPQDWMKHWKVDVGESSPLSQAQLEEFDQQCRYLPAKKEAMTRKLFYRPLTINGKALTLKSFREVIKNPTNPAKKSDYAFIPDEVLRDHGDTPNKISGWRKVTRDVIPDSLHQNYPEQQALIKPGDEVTDLLDAVLSSEMEYVQTGVALYGANTYLRTSQRSGGYQIDVGGWRFSGPSFDISSYDRDDLGVAAACGSS